MQTVMEYGYCSECGSYQELTHNRNVRRHDSPYSDLLNCYGVYKPPISQGLARRKREEVRRGMIETVKVEVTTDLLAELEEWSEPVEARIVKTSSGTGWEMTFRTHECKTESD